MNALERAAVADLIAKAELLGVEVPDQIRCIAGGYNASHAAGVFADQHPEDDQGSPTGDVPAGMLGCCIGSAHNGLRACTCWVPEWNLEQEPRLQKLQGPQDLQARDSQCSDCAFRRDSPERQDKWLAETLLALPERGDPFWCHDGMRRPVRWRHPAGVQIEGSTDDWQPPTVGQVPYRADGRPGLLCHGWAVRAVRSR